MSLSVALRVARYRLAVTIAFAFAFFFAVLENLSLLIFQACLATLRRANSSIIAVNAVVAPQRWIDLVVNPDIDILLA
jgi:hypothetical protein